MKSFFLFLFFSSTALAWGNRFEGLDRAIRTLSDNVNSLLKKNSFTVETLKKDISILEKKNKELTTIMTNQSRKTNALSEVNRPRKSFDFSQKEASGPRKRSSSFGRPSSQHFPTIRTIFDENSATIFGNDEARILDDHESERRKKTDPNPSKKKAPIPPKRYDKEAKNGPQAIKIAKHPIVVGKVSEKVAVGLPDVGGLVSEDLKILGHRAGALVKTDPNPSKKIGEGGSQQARNKRAQEVALTRPNPLQQEGTEENLGGPKINLWKILLDLIPILMTPLAPPQQSEREDT
jgi:hypothetical protein